MKYFYLSFLGIVFSLFFFLNAYAQEDFEIPQNKIQEVSRVLQVSDYDAEIVLRGIVTLVQDAQRAISRIASHNTSLSDKTEQMEFALRHYFARDAIMQVSSLNSRRLKHF